MTEENTNSIKQGSFSIEPLDSRTVQPQSIKSFSRVKYQSSLLENKEPINETPKLDNKEASSPLCSQVLSGCQPSVDHLTIFKDQRRDTPNRLHGFSLPSILASSLSYSTPRTEDQKPTNNAAKAQPTTPRDIHDRKCSIKQYIQLLLPLKARANGEETEPPILKTHQLRSERREKKMYAPLSYTEEKHALNYSARFDKQLNNATSVSGGIKKMIIGLSSPAVTPRKSTSVSYGTQSSTQIKKAVVPKLGISNGSFDTADVSQTSQRVAESMSARGTKKDRLLLSNLSNTRGALTERSMRPATICNNSSISNYIDRENLIELIRIYDSTRQILHNDLAVKRTRITELQNGIERSIKISVMRNFPNYCPAGFQCILLLPCCHYTFQDRERRLIGEFCRLCHVETRATVLINVIDCYGDDAYVK